MVLKSKDGIILDSINKTPRGQIMKQKLFSLMLTICMFFMLLPLSATAINGVDNEASVKFGDDTTAYATVELAWAAANNKT